MSHSFFLWCEQVKNAAANSWPDILQALAGLNDRQVNSSRSAQNKGTSCPVCSDGEDRYHFADKGAGLWYCRKCGGHDGIGMLQLINAWTFKLAMQKIAHHLGVEPYNDEYIDPEVQKLARQRAKQRKDESLRKKQQEDQEKNALAEKRAGLAQKQWGKGAPARTLNPYLNSHYLPPFDLREIVHREYGMCLMIPMIDDQGRLRNLQYIKEVTVMIGKEKKFEKRFFKGAQTAGVFYRFSGPDKAPGWSIYICEGWATGAAIHLNMPNYPTVFCAMSSGNLMAVVEIVKRLFPENRLVIAADHDEAGIKAAYKVAKKFGLEVVLPPAGMDFCDIHINRMKGERHER